jgi:pyrroloquinoline quinone (PQQ) biosynthesis protein C
LLPITDPSSVSSFVQNLIWLFHVVRASENLLVQAEAQADGPLREYFKQHLGEERGHAEWLREDLRSVGIDVLSTRPMPIAREMVGSIYYLIFHSDPAALLGYMQVLEGQAENLARMLPQLEAEHPASLLRTLKHHAAEDPGHFAELLAMIDELPEGRRAIIEETAEMTRNYLSRVRFQ